MRLTYEIEKNKFSTNQMAKLDLNDQMSILQFKLLYFYFQVILFINYMIEKNNYYLIGFKCCNII